MIPRKQPRSAAKTRVIHSNKNLELELCHRLNSGDLSAYVELSKHYSKLIKTIAKKYENKGLSAAEVILYAKIGLLKAAHRYDESKMVSFRLYAIWWMRQVILKALHEQAKIDQIPEMLILNLHEILNSFRPKTSIQKDSYSDLTEIIERELAGLIRFRKNEN